MKSILSILLASIFLFQSAGKLIIVANYQINKEYISKVLCENKAKPILKCNGKCHLRKQLQKEDKKEKNPANNVNEKFEVQYLSDRHLSLSTIITEQTVNHNFNYILSFYESELVAVFHPPLV